MADTPQEIATSSSEALLAPAEQRPVDAPPDGRPNSPVADPSGAAVTAATTDNAKEKDAGKKQHECKYCQKVFNKAAKLIVHERSHTGERPSKCPECSECYARESHLRRHIQACHPKAGEGKEHICDSCGHNFSSKDKLRRHRQKDCTMDTVCSECKFEASSAWHLLMHVRAKHQGKVAEEKPKVSKDEPAPKVYICYEGCSEAFATREERKAHIRETHGYVCNICSMKTNSATQRRDHIKAKHGEPQYCPHEDCDAVFTTEYNLSVHVDSIHKEHRHECPECDCLLSTNGALTRHRRVMHKVDADGKPIADDEEPEKKKRKRGPYNKAVLNRLVGNVPAAPVAPSSSSSSSSSSSTSTPASNESAPMEQDGSEQESGQSINPGVCDNVDTASAPGSNATSSCSSTQPPDQAEEMTSVSEPATISVPSPVTSVQAPAIPAN
eukprot:NODE_2152_length_1497_cov_128.933770_g2047_i0.p1 GENE.NODE_2152_length_1497_cov_128.933770_g2047_i0~~NODE_2152_length_1497_cov_128.933770_g2047_i0.p1  ORF type:complete len:461 (+),score=61.35 NODE_2152_length_1497_cov_128.933770_g2047_i0:62-1384(+)